MKYLIFFIMCVSQPICLPLPEASTILMGSVSLGSHMAFVIGLIGILIGIILMYKLSFYLGEKYLSKFKKSSNYQKYKKLISTNPFLTTGILFAIPILPDEIICVGSALGGVSLKVLMPIAVFAKSISIGMITYSSNIASITSLKQWQIIAIEVVFMLVFALIYSKIKKVKLV